MVTVAGFGVVGISPRPIPFFFSTLWHWHWGSDLEPWMLCAFSLLIRTHPWILQSHRGPVLLPPQFLHTFPRHPGPPPEVRYLDTKNIPETPFTSGGIWMSRAFSSHHGHHGHRGTRSSPGTRDLASETSRCSMGAKAPKVGWFFAMEDGSSKNLRLKIWIAF